MSLELPNEAVLALLAQADNAGVRQWLNETADKMLSYHAKQVEFWTQMKEKLGTGNRCAAGGSTASSAPAKINLSPEEAASMASISHITRPGVMRSRAGSSAKLAGLSGSFPKFESTPGNPDSNTITLPVPPPVPPLDPVKANPKADLASESTSALHPAASTNADTTPTAPTVGADSVAAPATAPQPPPIPSALPAVPTPTSAPAPAKTSTATSSAPSSSAPAPGLSRATVGAVPLPGLQLPSQPGAAGAGLQQRLQNILQKARTSDPSPTGPNSNAPPAAEAAQPSKPSLDPVPPPIPPAAASLPSTPAAAAVHTGEETQEVQSQSHVASNSQAEASEPQPEDDEADATDVIVFGDEDADPSEAVEQKQDNSAPSPTQPSSADQPTTPLPTIPGLPKAASVPPPLPVCPPPIPPPFTQTSPSNAVPTPPPLPPNLPSPSTAAPDTSMNAGSSSSDGVAAAAAVTTPTATEESHPARYKPLGAKTLLPGGFLGGGDGPSAELLAKLQRRRVD